jgi:hypothetical protein
MSTKIIALHQLTPGNNLFSKNNILGMFGWKPL